VQRQVAIPIVYDGIRLDGGLRLDLVVEHDVIVELKAVERLLPVNEAQILSYLKLSRKRLGYLINFNVPRIKEGIRRFAL
jgi:GxxExxY protein